MKVTVKYFGLASTRTSKLRELWTLPTGATLAILKDLINNKYHFENEMTLYYNLNGKGIASETFEKCLLSDGDVIMLIPQLSGG
jgi:molybdopterin converting factor small subunit